MGRIFQSIVVLGAFTTLLTVPQPAARADDSPAQKPAAASTAKPPDKAAPAKNAAKKTAPVKPASNQAGTEQEAPELNPVVVTATRIEQPLAEIGTTVTVVEDSQIEDQKIERVGDVLRQVPGVQVVQEGSPGALTDISIRGAPSTQTLILFDGVEVNAGATGGFDMANLTTAALDRIEVLRGAGGALYGSQAIGGVVNVIAQEGEGAPKFSLLSDGGNRATQNQAATASGAYGNLGYSAALSYFSTQGFRPVNDNSDNLSGSMRLDYHLGDDTVLRGFARYIASNVSLASYLVASGVPLDPTAHDRNEFMLFKGEIEHRFTDRLLARAIAFYVRQEVRLNATPFPGESYDEAARFPDETRGGNLETVYAWPLDYRWASGFRTLAGFNFMDRWLRSDDILALPPFGIFPSQFHARRQEYAGYVEQEGSFFDGHILATGGLRVDGNSQFGEEVSPAWSVAIPIRQISTTLRGSYSEGFRAPAFNELYYPDFGNPNLRPEISSEYDGGFTTAFGEIGSFTATYFSRRVHNLIVTVPCLVSPSCAFGSEAGNASTVDVEGLEAAPSVTIAKGLTFSGNVTVLDETHKNAALNFAAAFLTPPRPLRVPKHSAAALLQYERGGVFAESDRVVANASYVFVGDRDDITVAGPIGNHAAYSRVDATASYQFGIPYRFVRNEEMFVRIMNVLDRRYSEAFGFPAPPVNFVAGMKLDFE